jgi:hypothetical protein
MSCTIQKQISSAKASGTAINIKEASLLKQQVDSIMQPLLYPGGTTAALRSVLYRVAHHVVEGLWKG